MVLKIHSIAAETAFMIDSMVEAGFTLENRLKLMTFWLNDNILLSKRFKI